MVSIVISGARRLHYLALAAGIVLAACGGSAQSPVRSIEPSTPVTASPSQADRASGRTFTVLAGGSSEAGAEALLFGPRDITINAGDTLTWKIASDEPHTISFGFAELPPPGSPASTKPVPGTSFDGSGQISSGLLPEGKSFSVAFPTAGTYDYFCLIHQPSMRGRVTVQPAGSPYPATQEELTSQAKKDMAQANARAEALAAQEKPGKRTTADGHTTWDVTAGVGGNGASFQRFLGEKLTIKIGDTVSWTNRDEQTPHTITFLSGRQAPSRQDPSRLAPSGGGEYDGSGLLSSGLIGPAPIFPSRTYSLTFTKPGDYKYVCILHDEEGMVGSITVVP